MTDTSKPQWPWPFPYWDGARYVMPADLLPAEERKAFFKKTKPQPDMSDAEEALL